MRVYSLPAGRWRRRRVSHLSLGRGDFSGPCFGVLALPRALAASQAGSVSRTCCCVWGFAVRCFAVAESCYLGFRSCYLHFRVLSPHLAVGSVSPSRQRDCCALRWYSLPLSDVWMLVSPGKGDTCDLEAILVAKGRVTLRCCPDFAGRRGRLGDDGPECRRDWLGVMPEAGPGLSA